MKWLYSTGSIVAAGARTDWLFFGTFSGILCVRLFWRLYIFFPIFKYFFSRFWFYSFFYKSISVLFLHCIAVWIKIEKKNFFCRKKSNHRVTAMYWLVKIKDTCLSSTFGIKISFPFLFETTTKNIVWFRAHYSRGNWFFLNDFWHTNGFKRHNFINLWANISVMKQCVWNIVNTKN